MAELAEHVLLSRSGMTRLIDRLEREGFVSALHVRQGRARLLRGADRPRAVAPSTGPARPISRSCAARFLSHFSREELGELARPLARPL